MNRRTFFKRAAVAIVAVTTVGSLLSEPKREPFTAPLTDREKELVIAEALKTPEGRDALAKAMVEPIRKALDYHGVGKKLLLVDKLPKGKLGRYYRHGII